MLKKISKFVALLMIITILVIIIIVFEIKEWPIGSSASYFLLGYLVPSLISSFVDFADNEDWKTSQRKLRRGKILTKRDRIRISFAYLFRIKIDGKYFLVKNNRGTGKYQPVGGVYKLYQAEAEYLRTNYCVEDDNQIPVDTSSKNDYRLNLQDKYLRNFVKRFDKTKDRECISDLSREFEEELFKTGILNKDEFGTLKYTYCGRHITKLKYSEHFQCYEMLLADIVNVELNSDQEQQFRELMKKKSNKYFFATANEIKSLGVIAGSNKLQEAIADHTIKILQENADNLIRKDRNIKNQSIFEIVFK